jgi:hypothetical protein
MSGLRTTSVFDRPLRPDLAAFFAVRARVSKPDREVAQEVLSGILADLVKSGRQR